MRNLGLNGNTIDLLVAGGINILQFLAVFPAILYIDKWGGWPTGFSLLAIIVWIGRKPLLRGGSAVMTMSHLLCALLVCAPHMLSTIAPSNHRSQIFEFGSEWENHSIAAWVAVGYVFNFILVQCSQGNPAAFTFSLLLMVSVLGLLVGSFQMRCSRYL
jgi:hypothetical protein